MGDFNPLTPTRQGQEWQPTVETALVFGSTNSGWAQRIRPGSTTLAAIHRYHAEVVGAAPGLALEVVDTLMPTITPNTLFPGTDLGALTTTGWQDQAAGAATFARVDDKTDITDYIRNTSAMGIYDQRSIQFRGAGAALAGKRITYVAAYALVRMFSFTNTTDIGLEPLLTLGGNPYYGPVKRVPNDGRWYTPWIGYWRLNPSTDQPWTMANLNNLIQAAGTDNFGLRLSYPRPNPITANGFSIAGLWLEFGTAPENRVGGFYYDTRKALRWWQRFPLTSPSALAANTYYWMVEYPLVGGAGNFNRGVAHTDAKVVEPANASGTGEHRELVAVTLNAGVVTGISPDRRTVQDSAVTAGTVGQLLGGTLLEGPASAILSQSDPYVQIDRRKIAADSTANIGQEITGAAATTYGAITLPIAWNRAGVRPDRELTIEIRHGVGANTGGGTLDATATVQPDDIDGTLQRKQVPFAASFTSILNQQYVVLIKSSASTTRGWDIIRQDTHSDLIDATTATTIANVESASQGGQTDAYQEGASRFTRYDIPIDLIAAPAAPAGFTATALPAITNNAPPRVLLSWTATALGASFGKYRIWSRPSRTPALAWTLRAEITVNAGQTAATVEANHTKFLDTSPGVARTGGQYADGYDYTITVTNAANGLESGQATPVTRVIVQPDVDTWLTSLKAPWLNSPVWAQELQGADQDALTSYRALGRPYQLTRARQELPGRKYQVKWDSLQAIGEDGLRFQRAAAVSGRQLVLSAPSGDRIIGSISAPSTQQTPADFIDATATFYETDRDPEVADFNLPAGLILNGTTQALTTPSSALIDPLAGAFTIVLAGVFATVGSQKCLLSKGNLLGAANGYGIFTQAAANVINFYLKGASATLNLTATDAGLFDGNVHVLVCTSTGAAQAMYRDDNATPIATGSTTTGSLTNAVAFALGADNGGASAFASINPLHVAAYYPRVLIPAEAVAAARDGLAYPNCRMPGGSNFFLDLRDQRTWNGLNTTTILDTSGNNATITAVAAPTPRGLPWPFAELDKF